MNTELDPDEAELALRGSLLQALRLVGKMIPDEDDVDVSDERWIRQACQVACRARAQAHRIQQRLGAGGLAANLRRIGLTPNEILRFTRWPGHAQLEALARSYFQALPVQFEGSFESPLHEDRGWLGEEEISSADDGFVPDESRFAPLMIALERALSRDMRASFLCLLDCYARQASRDGTKAQALRDLVAKSKEDPGFSKALAEVINGFAWRAGLEPDGTLKREAEPPLFVLEERSLAMSCPGAHGPEAIFDRSDGSLGLAYATADGADGVFAGHLAMRKALMDQFGGTVEVSFYFGARLAPTRADGDGLASLALPLCSLLPFGSSMIDLDVNTFAQARVEVLGSRCGLALEGKSLSERVHLLNMAVALGLASLRMSLKDLDNAEAFSQLAALCAGWTWLEDRGLARDAASIERAREALAALDELLVGGASLSAFKAGEWRLYNDAKRAIGLSVAKLSF